MVEAILGYLKFWKIWKIFKVHLKLRFLYLVIEENIL
jgi:hypothetical protein